MTNKIPPPIQLTLSKNGDEYKVYTSDKDLDVIIRSFVILLKDSGFSEQEIEKALLSYKK